MGKFEFAMNLRDPKLILVSSIMLIIVGIISGFVAFPVLLRSIIKSVSWEINRRMKVLTASNTFCFFFFVIDSKQICYLVQEFVQFMRNRRSTSISSFTFLTWQTKMKWSKEVSSYTSKIIRKIIVNFWNIFIIQRKTEATRNRPILFWVSRALFN